MNKISIDSAVFNSHANTGALENHVERAGNDLLKFAKKLAKAANNTKKKPYAKFIVQKNNFEEDSPTKGLLDFTIVYTLIDKIDDETFAPEATTEHISNDDEPEALDQPEAIANEESGLCETIDNPTKIKASIGIVESSILDFSFDVAKDPHHIMIAACMLRTENNVKVDDDEIIYDRSETAGQAFAIDLMPEIANFLFSWMYDNIPEKNQQKFLDNCQKFGLVGNGPAIGFTKHIA